MGDVRLVGHRRLVEIHTSPRSSYALARLTHSMPARLSPLPHGPRLPLAPRSNARHANAGLTPARDMICASAHPFLYYLRRAPGVFAPTFHPLSGESSSMLSARNPCSVPVTEPRDP